MYSFKQNSNCWLCRTESLCSAILLLVAKANNKTTTNTTTNNKDNKIANLLVRLIVPVQQQSVSKTMSFPVYISVQFYTSACHPSHRGGLARLPCATDLSGTSWFRYTKSPADTNHISRKRASAKCDTKLTWSVGNPYPLVSQNVSKEIPSFMRSNVFLLTLTSLSFCILVSPGVTHSVTLDEISGWSGLMEILDLVLHTVDPDLCFYLGIR